MSSRYLTTVFEGKKQLLHRVIWFKQYGYWPKYLDHIEGNSKNNAIENLREVSHRENMQNKKRHREGKLIGASFHKQTNKWRSEIRIGSKKFHLGLFNTELEAHEAYINKLSAIKESSYVGASSTPGSQPTPNPGTPSGQGPTS